MEVWITRTSRELCRITTKPMIEKLSDSGKPKLYVQYGDEFTKQICFTSLMLINPALLRLQIGEKKKVSLELKIL